MKVVTLVAVLVANLLAFYQLQAAAFAIVIKTARTRSRDHGQPGRNCFEEKKTAIKKVSGRPNHAYNVLIFLKV